MEKGTGKGALEKKATPLFEKNFHLFFVWHGYRCSRQLVSSGSVKNMSKRSFLFYNFVKLWTESHLQVFYLSIHYLDCDFIFRIFFFGAVLNNIYAPHRWGGGGGGG